MTVALKFSNDFALAQKMAFAVADMAFGISEVTEERRPVHRTHYTR
jgi:hypothetical protein